MDTTTRICPDCGQPQHWATTGTERGGAWYHDTAAAMWSCTGQNI